MSKHAALNATLILVANTLLILAGVFMILVAAGTSFTSSTLSYTLPAWPTTSDNTVTKTQNTIIQYSFFAFGGILIASGVSAIVFLQRWWRRLDYTPVLFLLHATLCGLAELVALAALVFAILATVMASRNADGTTTDTPAVVSGGTANATSRWAYLCIASGVVFLVNSVAFFGAVAEHRAKIRQRRDLYVTEINASSPPEHTSGLADTKWMARMSESHSAKMYLDDNAGAARRKPSGAGGGGGAVAGIALTAPSLSASSSVTPYGPSGGAGGGSARSNHYYGQDRNSLYAYPGPHQLYQQHQQHQQQQQSYSHQSAPYGYPLATAAAAAAMSAAVVGASGRGGGRSNSAYYYPSGSTNDPYIQQPSIQPRVQQPDWDYSAHYTEELYPDYYHQSYQAQTYPAPQQQHQQQTLPPPPPPPSAQLDRRETRNLYSPLPFVEPALGATTTKSGASTYEYRPPPSPPVDEYGIRSSSHHNHHHSHPNAMRLDGDDDADTHVDGLSPAPPRRGARQQLASSSSYDLSRDSEAETRHDEEEEEEEYEDDDVDDRSDVFGVARGRDILPPRADASGGGGGGVSNNIARQDRRNSDDFDDTRTNLTTTTTTTARQQKEYEDTSSSVAGYAGSFYNSRRAGWVGASASGVGNDVTGGGGAAPHVLLAGHDQRARDSNVRYI
ncbi:hypothetical protein HDU88_005131 [Geranomyces variabilis]|nr:hypothetical protein HDU88_005131 [Geranomyces variabilis]